MKTIKQGTRVYRAATAYSFERRGIVRAVRGSKIEVIWWDEGITYVTHEYKDNPLFTFHRRKATPLRTNNKGGFYELPSVQPPR